MRAKMYNSNSLEIYCKKCQNLFYVDAKEDFQKTKKNGEDVYCFTCPECLNVMFLSGISVHSKVQDENYLENVVKSAEKFNQEFEGTFDKL